MLDITNELNEFITVLYGKSPTMNKTWQQLYPEAFENITKDVFRLHVSSARAALPCDQTHFMTFLAYEERLYMNNSKFVRTMTQESAMKLLQIAASIRTKVQTEYNLRLAAKRAAKTQGQ